MVDQSPEPLLRLVHAEQPDERGLVRSGVLADLLADGSRVAFDIENVVGDLERLTERRAEPVYRRALTGVRLAEDRAGHAGIVQQRSGLHGLQCLDFAFVERSRAL